MFSNTGKFYTISLLLLCSQASAAIASEACTDGSCAAHALKEDVATDQSKELSLLQTSAFDKRAQEAGGVEGAQTLDATYTKKGGDAPAPAPAPKEDAKAPTPAPKTKDTKAPAPAPKKESDSKTSSKDDTDSKASSKDDLWSERADGCCEGPRDLDGGKLFGGNLTSVEDCKVKCRTFKDCGSIEYGWEDLPQWCYVWSSSQKCEKMDTDCVESIPGNGKGVKNYLFTAPKVDTDVSKTKWKVVGDGCCEGLREEGNGKLYADKEKDLDACKARCLTFDNCGIVEYGWTAGDPEWCYIWDNSQKCEKQDTECKLSALGRGDGAQAHKYLKE